MSATIVKNKPLVIGITGGIATGKTTVTNYLLERGFLVADSDKIVSDLYQYDVDLIKKIEKTFDVDFKNPNYRKELSNIVFNDLDKKLLLNAIVHPKVYEKIVEFIKKNTNQDIIFLDIPLLYEGNMERICNYVILVYLDEENQIKRLMMRNDLSKKEALLRIKSQMSLEEKSKLTKFVINNNGSLEELYKNVDQTIEAIWNENK